MLKEYTVLNNSSGLSERESGPLSIYAVNAEENVLVSMQNLSRKPLLMASL